MYVIMCKIRSHSNAEASDDETRIVSTHPVHAVHTLRQVTAWMEREPEIILNHLNNILAEDKWEPGHFSLDTVTLWNKQHSLERIYYAVKVTVKGE